MLNKRNEYIIYGQGYFVKDKFLDDGRTRVAMMFRGKIFLQGNV
ncbi:hypothetical protein [Clostridium haemolyticum]|nr:hypothetical protein [Clostridium haemolyticum]